VEHGVDDPPAVKREGPVDERPAFVVVSAIAANQGRAEELFVELAVSPVPEAVWAVATLLRRLELESFSLPLPLVPGVLIGALVLVAQAAGKR
jgi:hypothetical protein